MLKAIDCHCHFAVEKLKRSAPFKPYDAAMHLEFMEKANIATSVISGAPDHCYEDKERYTENVRQSNEFGIKLMKDYPGKFILAASLPTPFIEESLEELKFLYENNVKVIKFDSSSKGIYLGHPSYEPVFDFMDEKSFIGMIHPTLPEAVPEQCFTATVPPMFEFYVDTTRTVIDMIANGMLERHQNVKIIVPHCGSFLPIIIDRLQSTTSNIARTNPEAKVVPIDPHKSLHNLYYDTAGPAEKRQFPALMKMTDSHKILFGSDYLPDGFIERPLKVKETVESSSNMAPYLQEILWENAAHLFGIE